MARVLLVGYDPDAVDYSNPALPTGMSAEKIRAGIVLTLDQIGDGTAISALSVLMKPLDRRSSITWLPPTMTALQSSPVSACLLRGLAIFEAVVNAVHKGAPGSAIAFNTRPEDTADAAARCLPHER